MEPKYHDSLYLPQRRVGLSDDSAFYPRFYTRGPFLFFLRINPEFALDTIIRIIDFSTERWLESNYEKDSRDVGIDLPLKDKFKRFFGDYRVYHWYHGVSDSAIIASALMAVEKYFYECIDDEKSIKDFISLILDKAKSVAFIGLLSEIGRYAPNLLIGDLIPLLLVPDTYYFETRFTFQGGLRFGTPFSIHEGEWFWEITQKWDTMKHRHHRLVDIAAYLYIRHHDTQQTLIEASQKWQEQIEDRDIQRAKFTKALVATFQLENWKKTELADGTKGIAFNEPDNLKLPREQVEKINKNMLLLTRPIECRKMLDKNYGISESKINNFLNEAKALYEHEPDSPDIKESAHPNNAVCGTIAVLFVQHRDWLKKHPEEESWCLQCFEDILKRPPPWPKFDIPESVGDYDWEHFACEIAAVLWAENPKDERWRELVGYLAMAKHYRAAGLLMKRLFEHRQVLGKGFWQFVFLMLEWAAVRYTLSDERLKEKQLNITDWQQETVNKFVKGNLQTTISIWGEESLKSYKLWWAGNVARYHREGDATLLYKIPGIDREQIQYAFESIFLPDQSIIPEERYIFYQFWDQALVTSLIFTCFFDDSGKEINPVYVEAEFPFEYDIWILKRIAVVISQMNKDDHPERYWQPILNLGPRAEHWVEHFLDHWFMDCKNVADQDRFIEYWQQMIEFCLSSKLWTDMGTSFSHALPNLWLCLIGLPKFVSSLWTEKDKQIIKEMEDYFVGLAPRILISRDGAYRMVSWLNEPAAEPIRLQMLELLYSTSREVPSYWWEKNDLTTVIARFLNMIWDNHRAEITSDDTLKSKFLDILHKVAARHDPLALELQSRIASR